MTDGLQNSPIKTNSLFEQNGACLFELSDSGTVLYCRIDVQGQITELSANAVRRNFFDEVAPFENTEELRPLLNRFVKSNYSSERLSFACRVKNQIVPTKIMLVRISERSGGTRGKTTFVDIRKI